MIEDYWQSTRPGEGRRAARAEARGDAAVLNLNGDWRFRLSPTPEGTGAAFVDDDADDADWDLMPVPSHWVLERFTPLAGGPARSMLGTAEGPLYTNTAYPIPLDAPRVPVENPTGDYRLVFDVPSGFGPAVLRFGGADSCAKVWLNGRELGWWTGSRLPVEFEAPVREGRNVLAVRVHRWSAGTYLEDQDMWWLPGIFRDVELLARPEGSIDDHFVHADYDADTGLGTFRVDASVAAVVEIPELGLLVPAGTSVVVPVQPWSAESPRLYRGSLRSDGERVDLAVGFRRIEIVDGVLRANGRPVVFHGVNRHEHHPRTGRTLSRDDMVRDVQLMKRANIDAVRTSHYPPHPEFLRLCDEYGLWVVAEVDLETHGFIYSGWEGNPPAEPAWRDALMDRLERTVEPLKNHPSIVVWSLANESWTGAAFDDMEQWLRRRDPSRPVLYERDPSYRNSDFYSVMYPSLELLERIGRREEPRGGRVGMHGLVFDDADRATAGDAVVTEADDARRRTLPFLLVEYAHAMGNGPGSLQDYWRIIRSHDRICGAFVWEWIDHGFATIDAEGRDVTMHGDDVDFSPRGGRFGLHGLVFSDRTPTPGLAELAKAHEPFEITPGDVIRIRSRRHALDSSDVQWRWARAVDGEPLDGGTLEVPTVAPGAMVEVTAPGAALTPVRAAEVVLTVEAVLREENSWADAGHVLAWAQTVISDAPMSHTAPVRDIGRAPSAATVTLGDARFDATTGRLRELGGMELDGPWIDLHRAPIENDHGQGELNDIASVWRATGMSELLHRTDSVEIGDGWLRTVGRTAPRTHPHAVAWTMQWTRADHGGLDLSVTTDFVGPWMRTPYRDRDIWVPRLGLRWSLPGALSVARWYGRGPGETYADSYEASRLGRFEAAIDSLQTPYPVPQENGNHVHTRWLELRGPSGGLRVEGRPVFDFTARRWTSGDLERAARPTELRDSGRVWLNVDHAQQGIGSASVGPALPEHYRIPRERTTWSMRLRPLA